jgi:Na+/proline symporter
MTSLQKTMLGISSFIPVALYLALIAVYAMAFSHLLQNPAFLQHTNDPNAIFHMYASMFKSIIIIAIPLFIVSIVLRIVYIVLAVNNTSINDTERIIWIIALALFGTVCFPIYFLLRVYGKQNNDVPIKSTIL